MRTINRSTSFKRDYKRIKASPQHKKDIDSLIEAALVLLLTEQTARANDLAKVMRANRNLSSKQNETALALGCEVLPSGVANGPVASYALITARRPEFFVVARRGKVARCRWRGSSLCPPVSTVLACALRASIPRIFFDSPSLESRSR